MSPLSEHFRSSGSRNTSSKETRRENNVPTRQLVINWVSQAWESISAETIAKSFFMYGISNAVDGSEDCFISNEIPKDLEDGYDQSDQCKSDVDLSSDSDKFH